MMSDFEEDITAAEAEWLPAKLPDAAQEESYETTRIAKVDAAFAERVLPLNVIKIRRTELGLDGELTREKLDSAKSLNGLCRKANGDIDRVSDWIKEDALKLQKLVNTRKNELKAEVAKIQQPISAFISKCKEEDAAAEQAKVEAELQAKREAEEAERKAAQAIEDARRAAEAEANRKEAARLSAEREKLAEEQRKINEANRAENARIETARRKIDEAQRIERERLAEERREFEATQRAAAKVENDRLVKIAAERIAEEAEQRRVALEAADKFNREQAAEKERLRLEAIEPDLPKLKRFAAAIKSASDKAPKLTSAEAAELSKWACEHLTRISAALLDFGTTNKETK